MEYINHSNQNISPALAEKLGFDNMMLVGLYGSYAKEISKHTRFEQDFDGSTTFLAEFMAITGKGYREGEAHETKVTFPKSEVLFDLHREWSERYGEERSALAITRIIVGANYENKEETDNDYGKRIASFLKREDTPSAVKERLIDLINGKGTLECFNFYNDHEKSYPRQSILANQRAYSNFMLSIVKEIGRVEMTKLYGFDHDEWVERFFGKSPDLFEEIATNKSLLTSNEGKRFVFAEKDDTDLFYLSFPILSSHINKNLAEFLIFTSEKVVNTRRKFTIGQITEIINRTNEIKRWFIKNHPDSVFITFAEKYICKWIGKISYNNPAQAMYILNNDVQSGEKNIRKLMSDWDLLHQLDLPFSSFLKKSHELFDWKNIYLQQMFKTFLTSDLKIKYINKIVEGYLVMYNVWESSDVLAKKTMEQNSGRDILFGKSIWKAFMGGEEITKTENIVDTLLKKIDDEREKR